MFIKTDYVELYSAKKVHFYHHKKEMRNEKYVKKQRIVMIFFILGKAQVAEGSLQKRRRKRCWRTYPENLRCWRKGLRRSSRQINYGKRGDLYTKRNYWGSFVKIERPWHWFIGILKRSERFNGMEWKLGLLKLR